MILTRKDDEDDLADGLGLVLIGLRRRSGQGGGRRSEGFVDLGPIEVEIAAQDTPEDALKRRHLGPLDRPGDKLQLEPSGSAVFALTTTTMLHRILQQSSPIIVINADASTSAHPVARLVGALEEDGRLPEHVPGLLELAEALAQGVVAAVHGLKAGLVLGELEVEFVQHGCVVGAGGGREQVR